LRRVQRKDADFTENMKGIYVTRLMPDNDWMTTEGHGTRTNMKNTIGNSDHAAGTVLRGQRGFVSSRQALVLLALLFLAPVFVAWFMHMGAEYGWRPGSTTNKGVLIQPPRPLSLPAGLVDVAGEPLNRSFPGRRWTLVYLGGAACGASCREKLDALQQIRIALGENMRRVQRLFLASGAADDAGLQQLEADYPGMLAARLSSKQAEELDPMFSVEGAPAPVDGNIYLVDPLGNLMMYYRPDADPRDVIQDLQRLLKYSHIG
jgi:cytochrome oxidase Cu insertion factor (SCO1/SenC/PrrC family)